MSFAPQRPLVGPFPGTDSHAVRHVRGAMGRVLVAGILLLGWGAVSPSPVAAADITIEPRALVAGHVRIGSWAGVVVTLRNSGPAVTGELRLTSGTNGRTSYGVVVD